MPIRSPKVLKSLALGLGIALGSALGQAQPSSGHFTMAEVLSYPFPSDLVSLPSGSAFAWTSDARGRRNVWLAEAPDYRAHRVTNYIRDSGQEITNLQFSHDGKYLVYVRGGDHGANWPEAVEPDPTASPQRPQMQVWAVALTGGPPRVLGAGDTPAISPDGRSVAFIRLPEDSVWIAPTNGSKKAQRLFFDLGKDSDLQWSPDGKRLAFVSNRGDHSFIGVYRDARAPIEYLLPSTARDLKPRWSPDGMRIAFARLPGEGGPPQSVLQGYWPPIPWSIWVADVRSKGTRVWQSPHTLRGSYHRYVDLYWGARNRLVFLSGMDGWRHLYTVSATGGTPTLLTAGQFMVDDVILTPDRRYLLYAANTGSTPGDDDRSHLYRVSIGGGAPVEITQGGHSSWTPVLTAGGKTLAFIDAGPRRPPVVMWGSITGANWQNAGGDVLPADFPTNELVVPRLVNFRAADGLRIQGQLFAAARAPGVSRDQPRRPGIIYVHGGPHRQMLLTWHSMDPYCRSYAVNQYLANHGYVVLSINYRLSIGYGDDFEFPKRAGAAGASEYQDVLAGASWLQHDPEVDPKRIGIWGGSYGGYLTALALARNSDIFKAGVDMRGVHDWSMSPNDWLDTARDRYQTPDMTAVKKLFWLSSPDSAIGTWKSPVLLIQGDDDRNVPFHQTVDLVRRLQLHHVPYQELVFPDETHEILLYRDRLKQNRAAAQFLAKELMQKTP